MPYKKSVKNKKILYPAQKLIYDKKKKLNSEPEPDYQFNRE